MEKAMRNNKTMLENKILNLRDKRKEIIESIEYLNLNLSELQEKLDSLRPELIELRKKRENYHMWLLQRGENEDKIQHKVIEPAGSNHRDEEATNLSNSSLDLNDSKNYAQIDRNAKVSSDCSKQTLNNPGSTVHSDSLNWFRTDLTREQAEKSLFSEPTGTYLVGKSSYVDKYVLSVVCQSNQAIHIVIDETNGKYSLKSFNQQRRLDYPSDTRSP